MASIKSLRAICENVLDDRHFLSKETPIQTINCQNTVNYITYIQFWYLQYSGDTIYVTGKANTFCQNIVWRICQILQ